MIKIIKIYLFLIFYCFIFLLPIKSQDNDECLACHNDPSQYKEVRGKKIPLYVNERQFYQSVHRGLKCITCHKGFDPYEIPHKPVIEPINCKSCHKNPEKTHLFHPQIFKATGLEGAPDVNCKGCHSYHYVQSPKNPNSKFHFSNLTNSCGDCHKQQKIEFQKSEHYKFIRADNPNTPHCMYCHKHPITKGSKLSLNELKVKQMDLCLSCHLADTVSKSRFAQTLMDFEKSVHGQAILKGIPEAPVCSDCHSVHQVQKADDPESIIHKFNVSNVCGKCHISIAHEYNSSIHGISLKKGNEDAPYCTYCHGEHNIKSVDFIPERVFTRNHINKLVAERTGMIYCVGCHSDEALSRKYNINTIEEAHKWLTHQAKHWETVRCIDCHSSYLPPNLSHNILPPDKTVKKCEECHSKNSILMTKLYKHEKAQSRQKYGFINGTLLSDAYVIGTTRNVFLESVSIIIFAIALGVVGLHGFLRWYFNKATVNITKTENKEDNTG